MTIKIAICGSMTFYHEMEQLAEKLSSRGCVPRIPEPEEESTDYSILDEATIRVKRRFVDAHLAKIRKSDIALIANFEKHGIPGYVGANTLMEAAFAYAFGKPVVYLYMPGNQPCQVEAASMAHSILAGDIDEFKPMNCT